MTEVKFTKYKIRRNIVDKVLHSVKRSFGARASLSIVAAMLLVAVSINLVSAAPTTNPPNSNVVPNFSGINVNTSVAELDASYAKTEVSEFVTGNSFYPYIDLLASKSSTIFSKISLGNQANLIEIEQRDQSTETPVNQRYINSIKFWAYLGMLIQAEVFALNSDSIIAISAGTQITLSSAVTAINSATINLGPTNNSGSVNLYGNVTARNNLNVNGLLNLNSNQGDNLGANLVSLGIGVLREELNSSPNFSRVMPAAPRNAPPIQQVSGSWVAPACSGTTTEGGRSNYSSNGNQYSYNYGVPISCGYQLQGDVGSGISIKAYPDTSLMGTPCRYDWTAVGRGYTGSFRIQASTLCYRAEAL